MKFYKIIFLFTCVLTILISSCQGPDLTPTPPPPSCEFGEGSLSFGEFSLEYDTGPNLMPKAFDDDHNTGNGPFIESFQELFDENYSSPNPDYAIINLSVIGIECDGSADQPYTRHDDTWSGYFLDYPWETQKAGVELSFTIKSAEYDNKYCFWSFSIPKRWYSKNSNLGNVDFPLGIWMPVDKAQDNGMPRKVYVTDVFNQYIYTL